MPFFNPEKFHFEKEPQKPEGVKIEIEWGKEEMEEFYGKLSKYSEIRSLKAITPEGKELDFISLLPKGWKFFEIEGAPPEKGAAYFTDYKKRGVFFYSKTPQLKEHYIVKKIIEMPQPYRNERGGRVVYPWGEVFEYEFVETKESPWFSLSILHEIAHALKPLSLVEGLLYKKMEEKRLRRVTFISPEERKRLWKYVVKVERDAYAFALKKYRELKEKGIDLLPGKRNKEILGYIRFALLPLTYGRLEHFLLPELIRKLKKERPSFFEKILDLLKEILEK